MRPEHEQKTAQNRLNKRVFQENQLKELQYMKLNFNNQEYDLMTACTYTTCWYYTHVHRKTD